jgi:hypothetical protein
VRKIRKSIHRLGTPEGRLGQSMNDALLRVKTST